MRLPRASGILLHPTSLPGRYGIGELGQEAFEFIDFLAGAGQRVWQVLPLGPTGYGDSPYQCFSAFAGNPLLISLERLVEAGLLEASDLTGYPALNEACVAYGEVIHHKMPLLNEAAHRFHDQATAAQRGEYEQFCHAQQDWLEPYALFMACKAVHHHMAWTHWEPAIRDREPKAVEEYRQRFAREIETQRFLQFEFFRQWQALRQYARERGISVLGDLPIYVAHDSADVWVNRQYFKLEPNGQPTVIAGVPPDYFSATGQCWGNPIYRWDVLRENGYSWWVRRFQGTLALFDMVRLDHFRGFEAYYEIPGTDTTAVRGQWVKGPGGEMFREATRALGELPIIAENLGVITPDVEAIREEFGFPGMAILQFAFGRDPQGPDFKPHNYPRHRVAYTGTHDNDTTVGWWTSSGEGDSTRTAREIGQEREFTRRYLNTDGVEIHWTFIRALMASVADLVLFPMQDVAGLGSGARMNLPGTTRGNWAWRCHRGHWTADDQRRLRSLAEMYDRV